MKMKKTLGILIAASMVLAACGGNSSGTSETKAAASGTEAVTKAFSLVMSLWLLEIRLRR